MRDLDSRSESEFFALFRDYFDSERDAGRQHDPANYSLERMYPLAEAAGNPERGMKVIHVAGTKGKGTTSHFIASLLQECGRRPGLFTSPHLCTVRERFEIDGQLVGYERLIEGGRALVRAVRTRGLKPSLFELFTVLALQIFREEGVDYAVMETGIGGRLDATNYIRTPQLCVITPVSFDHTALLGNTIEQIASEKAGIIKPGVPLVVSRQPYPAADAVIRARAAELGAPVLAPVPHSESNAFLPGIFPEFLRDNFASALAGSRALGLSPTPGSYRLPQLRARFEIIHEHPTVMLDGAHNGDSMEKLVSSLNAITPGVRWRVVLGCVAGKDVHRMTAALSKLPGAVFVLTNPRTSKGSALEQLRTAAEEAGLDVESVIPTLTSRQQLPVDRPLLFTGSFFTALIGESLWNDT